MNIKISYFVSSNTYFFSSSYHKLNVDQLTENDQHMIKNLEPLIKKEKIFIYIVDGNIPNKKIFDRHGKADGMVAYFKFIDDVLYVRTLGKAKIVVDLEKNDFRIIPDPFFVYDRIELSEQLSDQFFELAENSVINKDFKDYQKTDEMLRSENESAFSATFLNHLIGLENKTSRKMLFRYYESNFHMKLTCMILEYIKGYMIDFTGLNCEIRSLFKEIDKLKSQSVKVDGHEDELFVQYKDRSLQGEYFYDIKKVDLQLVIDDQGIDMLNHKELKDLIQTPSDYLSIFQAYHLRHKEKEEFARMFYLILTEIEDNLHHPFDITAEEIEAFLNEDAEENKIETEIGDKELVTKTTLTKEERDQLYYQFLQMDAKTFYPKFQSLEYIPKHIRNSVEPIDFQSTSGQKEKQRLLNIIRLPWSYKTEDKEINQAKKILDEDHYGLENVKIKILEYITMLKYSKTSNGKILCLYGPPGVGKTSIAKNVAKALGRSYASLSLGSISSELDIQGINASYVGASSGGVINQLIKAGSQNPVFLLDELDKVPPKGSQGNIVGILMHILDSTLNNEFVDSFLNLPYDLSDILFICTANDLSKMPAPLRNRIEIVDISAYTSKEKLLILKQYIIPKLLENLTIDYDITFDDEALELITERYALDGGMRDSKRYAETLMSRLLMHNENQDKKIFNISADIVIEFLGDKTEKPNNFEHHAPGIVNLLSASAQGGSIIKLEVAEYSGHGLITTTGNLQKVIDESCNVAFGYLHSHYDYYKIPLKKFDNQDFHFHFSEGAISKDGPSGGVGICVAMYSALIDKKVSHQIAFTGEITLKGKILPVGGLMNKLSICEYEGIEKVYVPLENKEDVEKIRKDLSNDLDIRYVDHVDDIIAELF